MPEITNLDRMPDESMSPSVTKQEGDAFVLPMSFGQEQLWLIDQMAPGNTAYNVLAPFRIRGSLNVTALEATLNEIVRRHEVLRTTFEFDDTGPVQIIAGSAKIPFTLVDLCNVPDASREAELLQRMSAIGTLPFDLKNGPLCRAHLFKCGPEHHVLLWNMHHIVSDGWSYTILTEEIGSILAAFLRGQPSPLPELPIQYADFSQWQREQFTPQRIESESAWWKQKLQGAPTVIELPTDRPFGPTPCFEGRIRILHFKPELIERLQSVAKDLNSTFFNVTFAAYFILLHRYTGQADLVAGTPIANRGRVEVEPLIGYFVNTLPIRMTLQGDATFLDVLTRLRTILEEAYGHQELPFEKVVARLHPDRTSNRNPVFQVCFQCHKAFITLPQVPGLEFTHIHIDRHGTPVDLNFAMIDRDGHWRISAEYATEIFNEATIDRMLGHYKSLLEGIVLNPNQRISDLPLLTENERSQLVVDWNRTQVEYPRNHCLHELIQEQVKRTPDAPAVFFEGTQLTYLELEKRANHLARHLQKLGVEPDTLVGICMERSLEMVVGLLGILKAGGAYVPIDPDYPKERLTFMLEDAGVPILLTQSRLVELLPSNNTHIISLDLDWCTIVAGVHTDVRANVAEHHLAYMIYTSGSTGRPKGAMNTHVGIVNRLLWMQDTYRLTPADRVLQKTPFSFDVSVWEFFWPLLAGAALVLARPGGHRDPAYLVGLIKQKRITTAHFVPSMLAAFLDQTDLDSSCACLRRVICSGEALPFELQQRFFAKLPAELHNLYGPTEAAVDVTYWECERSSRLGIVPIGRPIANTQIYILDPELQPVPIGVAGELYIGGIGLARGYHKRSKLTAEKFISNPFESTPGSRLYRSGDRARYLVDGNIEYLGRLDHQVKIRGFRIEPGEIESVLCQHPAVKAAVVVAREDSSGSKQLVAYLAVNGQRPSTNELRDHLKRKVPDYMVPAAIVFLEGLPLTPNGKVDRKALPKPDSCAGELHQSRVAPRTATEQILCSIWCEALALEQVGIHDNFFELGGNSLLAVRLQGQIEKQLDKKLVLAAFFQAPTIAEQSELLKGESASAQHLTLLTPQTRIDKPPLFCLHFLDSARRLAKHLNPNRPIYSLASPFDEELRVWHESHQISITVEDLASRCLAAIRHVQTEGPYYLTGFCFGGTLAFEIASQLTSLGERIAFLGLLDAFYSPGCKRLSHPWLRRWAYHGKRVSAEGISYFSRKVGERRSLARKRKLVSNEVNARDQSLDKPETASLRLPQAQFIGQLVHPYRARPYAGDAILIRSVSDSSFYCDPGAANGWNTLIQGDLRVYDLECGHMEISEEPHVKHVAKLLDRHLDQVDTEIEFESKSTPAYSR